MALNPGIPALTAWNAARAPWRGLSASQPRAEEPDHGRRQESRHALNLRGRERVMVLSCKGKSLASLAGVTFPGRGHPSPLRSTRHRVPPEGHTGRDPRSLHGAPPTRATRAQSQPRPVKPKQGLCTAAEPRSREASVLRDKGRETVPD